jgi:hypothetical protein
MSSEMNVYAVGSNNFDFPNYSNRTEYAENHGNFVFRKSTSKNMDKLWTHFYKNESYPQYYLGIAKRIAICKCPTTGEEEWHNGERCIKVENPIKDSTITVELQIKDKTYTREFIFMGWVKFPVHEWMMSKGTVLMLEQKFIDGLLPEDKRYLKINR